MWLVEGGSVAKCGEEHNGDVWSVQEGVVVVVVLVVVFLVLYLLHRTGIHQRILLILSPPCRLSRVGPASTLSLR